VGLHQPVYGHRPSTASTSPVLVLGTLTVLHLLVAALAFIKWYNANSVLRTVLNNGVSGVLQGLPEQVQIPTLSDVAESILLILGLVLADGLMVRIKRIGRKDAFFYHGLLLTF